MRTSLRFPVVEFDRLLRRITRATRAGHATGPADHCPPIKPSGECTHELPPSDASLIATLERYLDERALNASTSRPIAPLFLTQEGGSHRPNTLQDHAAATYGT